MLKFNVKVFQGSENDLVDRYFKAAKSFNTKYICRLPADNPAPEPSEIDKLIQFHKENNIMVFLLIFAMFLIRAIQMELGLKFLILNY